MRQHIESDGRIPFRAHTPRPALLKPLQLAQVRHGVGQRCNLLGQGQARLA